MNKALRSIAFVSILFVTPVAFAGKGITLEEAVERMFAGNKVDGFTLDRHGFDLEPVVVVKTSTGLRAEGRFRHRIVGKNDWIFYELVAEKGSATRGAITKIVYRGLRKNWVVRIISRIDSDTADDIGAAQTRLVGKWEPTAQKIVDAMAARLSQNLP